MDVPSAPRDAKSTRDRFSLRLALALIAVLALSCGGAAHAAEGPSSSGGTAPPPETSPAPSGETPPAGSTEGAGSSGGTTESPKEGEVPKPPPPKPKPKPKPPTGPTAHHKSSHHTSHGPSFLTGIGDEETQMFASTYWKQLHTRIVRYIVPYDAAVRPYSLKRAAAWIAAAEAAHQQILIAFYHSEYTPMRMPSPRLYQRDVGKFIHLFPHVREYQPWNEANRGYVRGYFASPSAVASALYYQALRRVCHGCTIVGLDILDQADVWPTLSYIEEFKREIHRLHTIMPGLWGLHDYSDTNRFSGERTRLVARAVPGHLWLTETGGIVQFGRSFPNVRGSGLRRAARALHFMFALAHTSSKISRLYIFQWTGATRRARFDAGLMDAHFRPRPGYVVVCRALKAPHCNAKVAND